MIPMHVVNVANGSDNARGDQIVLAKFRVANLIGSGAGVTMVTAVVFGEAIPLRYNVHLQAGQDAVAWVDTKTASGFNLNLAPRLAANTLAAGFVDVTVIA